MVIELLVGALVADRGAGPRTDEVLAIVLTYSAPNALVACVRALMSQSFPPDEILVIDNASDPPATQSLNSAGVSFERVRVRREPQNTGPAGGHAVGLSEFLASEYRLAWVMDDDCTPEPDCLRKLLDASDSRREGVLTFPTWITPDGAINGYPAWAGFVISKDVVRRAGLPRSELVWWAEDTEYLMYRMSAAGYAHRHCEAARVLHTRVRATPHRPDWKFYYEARNSVYVRLDYRRNRLRIFRSLGRLMLRVALLEDQRTNKLWFIVRGVFDGLRGRLGMRVPIG